MQQRILTFAAVIITTCCLGSQSDSLNLPNTFNGSILLAEKDQIVYSESKGFESFQSKKPNSASSRFNLASVSKVITSTAILQLEEQGKLNIDDAVMNYLESFPFPSITIRHLLSHTSGLPDLELYEGIVKAYPDSIVSNSTLIPALRAWSQPLNFKAGDAWRYANTNYDLLALIVEQVTHRSFNSYLQKYIFSRCGMKESYVYEPGKNDDGVTAHVYPNWFTATYADADSIERFRYININLRGLYGSTNIISTTADLLRFDQAIFSGKLLKPSTLAKAFTPVKLNDGSTFYEASMDTMQGEGKGSYGLGWSIFELPDGKGVGHGGFNYGLCTFYFHAIDRKQTIIAFDNTASAAFGKIVTDGLSLLNGRAITATRQKTSAARVFGSMLKEEGIDQAFVRFHRMKVDTANFYVSERELNWLGYDFLRADWEGSDELARFVFRMNTILFPKSFNVYDSYGDALLKSGHREEARAMFRRSLDINPDNSGGREKLKLLE